MTWGRYLCTDYTHTPQSTSSHYAMEDQFSRRKNEEKELSKQGCQRKKVNLKQDRIYILKREDFHQNGTITHMVTTMCGRITIMVREGSKYLQYHQYS